MTARIQQNASNHQRWKQLPKSLVTEVHSPTTLAIRMLLSRYQTCSLEALHSLDKIFASLHTVFGFLAMLTRYLAYFVFLTLVDSNRHFCSQTDFRIQYMFFFIFTLLLTALCYDENGDRLHTMTKKGKPKSTHDVCVLSTGRSVLIFFNLSKPLDH